MSKAQGSLLLRPICAFGLVVAGACSKDTPKDHEQRSSTERCVIAGAGRSTSNAAISANITKTNRI
jgi:hypothetical protein